MMAALELSPNPIPSENPAPSATWFHMFFLIHFLFILLLSLLMVDYCVLSFEGLLFIVEGVGRGVPEAHPARESRPERHLVWGLKFRVSGFRF